MDSRSTLEPGGTKTMKRTCLDGDARRLLTTLSRGKFRSCQFWKVPRSSSTFPRPSRNSAAVQMIPTRPAG